MEEVFHEEVGGVARGGAEGEVHLRGQGGHGEEALVLGKDV